MQVIEEAIGADPKSIPNKHLFAKLENPDHVLPTGPLIDTEAIVNKGGDMAGALGFMIFHCRGRSFAHAFSPIPEATLGELVARLAARGSDAFKVMLCVLAQGVADEGRITLEDLGVTLDQVWEIFPHELESRENPLGALGSGQLLGLLRCYYDMSLGINGSGRFDSPATFEWDWDSFTEQFREDVWNQMKVLKKRMKKKTVGDLTESDNKMLEVLRSKNKRFGYDHYD